jgi:hypothetical protein
MTVILGGIIIQFLVRPYLAKVSGGFHKMVCYVEQLRDSKIDPSKTDKKGYPVLIATHELVEAIRENKELFIKHCDSAFCPVVPIIMKDWKETRDRLDEVNSSLLETHRELRILLTQMAGTSKEHLDRASKVKTELEKSIIVVLERDEKQQKETRDAVNAGYERMNDVLNTILADKNVQMAENNALMGRVVTALEKLASEKTERMKNGGK